VDVGRQRVRLVEGAHANEADSVAGPCIVAPNGNPAGWAAEDPLALAAVGRRIHKLGLSRQENHPVCLDHCVQRKRGTRFSLAPAAVAAMHEQRLVRHSVADRPASAAAFKGRIGLRWHRMSLTNGNPPGRGDAQGQSGLASMAPVVVGSPPPAMSSVPASVVVVVGGT